MTTIEQSINQGELQEEENTTHTPEFVECRKLLSPCNIDVEDTSHLAVDDLRFALEQANSRNIAITGHYGSGKSSVANTCIEEMGIEDKVLRISMSTFSLQKDKDNKNENSLYSDDIEYKIVQTSLLLHQTIRAFAYQRKRQNYPIVGYLSASFLCRAI